MKGFLDSFDEFLQQTNPESVLEIGCGEGHMLETIRRRKTAPLYAIDVDLPVLEEASTRSPETQLAFADGHYLPYADKSFSLTVACEVLEHVANPDQVLTEIRRVTRDYCIVSVPREPIWRVLNVARGKYIQALGNTPGHINHWSTGSFVGLLKKYVQVIDVRQPLPWTMVFAAIQ